MLSSLRLESVACRFQPFVGDLRSFLKESDVAYGFPEHLRPFTDRLSNTRSLRAGVSAKLFEVIRGVQQPTSHGELVELLLVTVGGANIDEDTPNVQKAERVLSQLVGQVMTSQELVAPPEQSTAETAVEHHAPGTRSASVLPPTEHEAPARTEQASPGAIGWASPPSFVWAALLCGVLLPPFMYFLSRPHEGQTSAQAATTNSSAHRAVPTASALNPVVLPLYDPKPLDLDIDGPPAPKKRSHGSLTQPRVVQTSDPSSSVDLSSALAPVDIAPSWTGTDKSSRESEMPGRDLGPPPPVSAKPQGP